MCGSEMSLMSTHIFKKMMVLFYSQINLHLQHWLWKNLQLVVMIKALAVRVILYIHHLCSKLYLRSVISFESLCLYCRSLFSSKSAKSTVLEITKACMSIHGKKREFGDGVEAYISIDPSKSNVNYVSSQIKEIWCDDYVLVTAEVADREATICKFY